MMKLSINDHASVGTNRNIWSDSGVSSMVEYMIISGVLMILIIITVLSVPPVFIDRPLDQLTEYAFIDIGNGVSTRIVDLYIVRPDNEGKIITKFDIPDDIAGRGYIVSIGEEGDTVIVLRDNIRRVVELAGIGQSVEIEGRTTGQGLNEICYDSERNCWGG
jgi:hypothetical protein